MKTLILLLISFKAIAYDVSLAWSPSPDHDVASYCIYWRTPTTAFTLNRCVPSADLQVTITGLVENELYTFYATSRDSHNAESGPSNEATYVALPRLSLISGQGIKMNVQVGNTYQIQQSTDLKSWTTIATIFASSNTINYPIRMDQPKMFFRLKRN